MSIFNDLMIMLKYARSIGLQLIPSTSKKSYWTPQVQLLTEQHIEELNKLCSPIGFVAKIIKAKYKGENSSLYIGPETSKQHTDDELGSAIVLPQQNAE